MEPSDFLISSTIRIETTVSNGTCTGTGFFFSLKNDEDAKTCVPVIVTNKHVIKNAISGKLRFSLKDSIGNPLRGEYYDLVLNNFESLWIPHPDKTVDLCVLPIANVHREIQKLHKDLNYTMLRPCDIPTPDELQRNFSCVEDIVVVGYPDGIWDPINNIPIVRKGITATPLQVDFEGKSRFLIDAAIFGGSSGSPAYVFNQGSYSMPGRGLFAGSRLKLVGVVYAVAQHTVAGDVEILDVPAAKTLMTKTAIPNNLGVAIHTRKILDFENMF